MTDTTKSSPKSIVVLADGTGNSAAKFFKTNVWRLYQALDLHEPHPKGFRQIAYYHDGVGTSSVRPLAMLGGVFGWGLKRNIIDLYSYLSRNYEAGDRLYFFGFSRGAFTIRILVGLITSEGLLKELNDDELSRYSQDAYRAFRRRFNPTGGLVSPLRKLRDKCIHAWRSVRKQTKYDDVPKTGPVPAEFVGVWDTVAAYGTPLAELTRGIDDWIWPLSMPDYKLSQYVKNARHALALDDERDTFHPLLWDEVAENALVAAGKVSEDRLRQVWFAGSHSDVGGGYPADSLSHVSLLWMLGEAQQAGLRFDRAQVVAFKRRCDPYGPMHDSRRGIAGYYRYQPRRLSAVLNPPDRTTLIMRDPDLGGHGLLQKVKVHESVFDRTKAGTDRYAPIVLPDKYEIVRWDGKIVSIHELEPSASVAARAAAQEALWNDVWRKRVNYFAMVAVSLALALLPLKKTAENACVEPQCVISPIITAIGTLLPGFAQPWIVAFARNPGQFLLGAVAIGLLLVRSAGLQRRIRDTMRGVWKHSLHGISTPSPRRWSDNWIQGLRTNTAYLRVLQWTKWKFVPFVFGAALLAIAMMAPPIAAGYGYMRARLVWAEQTGQFCHSGAPGEPVFRTGAMCWDLRQQVQQGQTYRVTLEVTAPWMDATIDTTPEGLSSDRMPWYTFVAVPLRRSIADRWYQPILEVRSQNQRAHFISLDMRRSGAAATSFLAEFTAPISGELFLFVNDAVVPCCRMETYFYDNNSGSARVSVEDVRTTR